jgi:PTS system D-glucosamine-specific IIC component
MEEKKQNSAFGVLQRVGHSFMLPVALLPIAGLLLGVGSSFTNTAMINAYHLQAALGKGTVLNAILTIMSDVGNIIFTNLPLIFAIGVAIGMAKAEKATAALSAGIAFLVMHTSISGCLKIAGNDYIKHLPDGSITSVCGINSLQMGVFGGIIVGLGVAALHNKFYKIELPSAISFFGGIRFIPIISTIVYLFVGILMFFVWPPIQTGIYWLGSLVYKSGYLGTFIYGIIERALIPFGLHPIFYLPFWQTGLGGTMMIDGKSISGAQNIFFAQLASSNTKVFSVSATRFMTGKFPFMIFGLPGAALAMYVTAKPNKKKQAKGLLLSAAFTSALTGITEPIEFSFLFVAPALYGIHCVLAGLSFMLMHLLDITVGMTFSGGIIDMFLFGILQGNAKTHWVYVILVGAVYFVLYFFLFRFLILKFNLPTPGREADTEETKLYMRKDVEAKNSKKSSAAGDEASNASSESKNGADDNTELIVEGLGGAGNIVSLDACATRLRITVNDGEKVSDGILKKSGALAVIKKGNGVQVVYGPRVTVIKSKIEDYLHSI